MKTWKFRNAEFATDVKYRLTVSCDTKPVNLYVVILFSSIQSKGNFNAGL